MKPRYLASTESRLAGAERAIRFLQRRQQLPQGFDGGGGGGDGSTGLFAAVQYDVSAAPAGFTDLQFTSGLFATNDATAFDISGDEIRILREGCYQLTGGLNPKVIDADTGVLQIQMALEDSSSNLFFGVTNSAAAISSFAVLTGDAFVPTLHLHGFYNFSDAAFGPPDYPVVVHLQYASTLDGTNDVDVQLTGNRFDAIVDADGNISNI